MKTTYDYDLVCIGSGPAGQRAAVQAGRAARAAIADELAAALVHERAASLRAGLLDALEAAGRSLLDMHVVAEMGSTGAIKQAVKAGVGVSVMSSRAVEDECRLNLLACVKLQDVPVTRQFYVVTHASRSRSPLCRAFLDFLESSR